MWIQILTEHGVADCLREDGCLVCPRKDVNKLSRLLSPMLTSKLYRSQASASPAKPPVAAAPKTKAGNSGKSKAKAKAKPKGKAPHGGSRRRQSFCMPGRSPPVSGQVGGRWLWLACVYQ